MSDFFKFEEGNLDFPFYNGKPLLSLKDWFILLLGVILYIAIISGVFDVIPGFSDMPNILLSIIHFLVLFLPVFCCCRGKIGLIFRKPKLKDMKVVILCFVAYILFSSVMKILLGMIFTMPGNSVATSGGTGSEVILMIISMLIGLMAEELVKVITFLLFMTLIFKYTENRRTSMTMGIILCCIVFGLLHLRAYAFNLVVCLLIVGVGCIIHLYPYLKTKNIVNSYLTHIMIDLLGVVVPLILLGIH